MSEKTVYRIQAPAKINLFLDVLSVLPNGYHEIDTVMQSVSLCDDITIESGYEGLSVLCSVDWLGGRDNLAHKAALLFSEASGIAPEWKITIDKKIPIAGGLAGGSTDAAAVLYALNEMYKRPLDITALYSLAGRLGADVTFCVLGGTMRARGIGELLTPCKAMPPLTLLVVIIDTYVSSAEAYKKLDEGGFSPIENRMTAALESQSTADICSALYNIFERNIPESAVIKRLLCENGAIGALMSGSGPTVFGIFDNDKALKQAENALNAAGMKYAVCRPTEGRTTV